MRDRPVARLFLDAPTDIRDDAQPSALEVMNQLGVLSAMMPEWAPCVGRVQHDLYHVYTVDQHQLYALAMRKRLARGELAARACRDLAGRRARRRRAAGPDRRAGGMRVWAGWLDLSQVLFTGP